MEEITYPLENQKEFIPIASEALKYSIWGNALSFSFFIPILGIIACVIGFILSIVGLNKARKAMEIYRNNKHRYYGGSFAKSIVAFVLGIVGIVQASLISLYALIFTAMIKEFF